MKLRHLLPILLLPLAAPRLEAAERWGIDQHTLLYAIGEVERNPWRRPGGLYGYTPATWRQYSTLPYRMAQNPAKAKETAFLIILETCQRLERDGLKPTPYLIAMRWRWGYEGMKRRLKTQDDYGQRVTNIYLAHLR